MIVLLMAPGSSTIALAIAGIALMPVGASAERAPGPALLPPVNAACISSPFGPRVLPDHPAAGTYHPGIDLPAPVGSPVFATGSGTVVRVQRKGPGGLEMLVQHDGFLGVYSHFGMIMPAFAEGKRTVAAGEKLGVVGRTGITSGAHLYFGMILAGRPVDPAQYLGVPICNGAVRRAQPGPHDTESAKFDGRRYYQLFLPARHEH